MLSSIPEISSCFPSELSKTMALQDTVYRRLSVANLKMPRYGSITPNKALPFPLENKKALIYNNGVYILFVA
jgi:hypothetical protein